MPLCCVNLARVLSISSSPTKKLVLESEASIKQAYEQRLRLFSKGLQHGEKRDADELMAHYSRELMGQSEAATLKEKKRSKQELQKLLNVLRDEYQQHGAEAEDRVTDARNAVANAVRGMNSHNSGFEPMGTGLASAEWMKFLILASVFRTQKFKRLLLERIGAEFERFADMPEWNCEWIGASVKAEVALQSGVALGGPVAPQSSSISEFPSNHRHCDSEAERTPHGSLSGQQIPHSFSPTTSPVKTVEGDFAGHGAAASLPHGHVGGSALSAKPESICLALTTAMSFFAEIAHDTHRSEVPSSLADVYRTTRLEDLLATTFEKARVVELSVYRSLVRT